MISYWSENPDCLSWDPDKIYVSVFQPRTVIVCCLVQHNLFRKRNLVATTEVAVKTPNVHDVRAMLVLSSRLERKNMVPTLPE